MGCASSMDTSNNVAEDVNTGALMHLQQNGGMDSTNIINEFVRLDEQISKLEATCPGPRMATVEAWIEHLSEKRNTLLGVEGLEQSLAKHQQQQQEEKHVGNDDEILTLDEPTNIIMEEHFATQQQYQQQEHLKQNGFVPRNNVGGNVAYLTNVNKQNNGYNNNNNNNSNNVNNNDNIVTNTPNKDLANLALNIGVIGDVQKASTHEDFFANLSDSALHLTATRFYSEILEHTKVRLKTLTESYAELNELYVNHDGIIAFISGGTYMSHLENSLDSQLETARDMRDKLGSALEQWRISGTLLRTCATSATQALQQWQQLADIINPKEKIQAALSCRNALQASLISLECAQLALPHVEMKYISNRQILAVKHCNLYMITDIANLSRYQHTTKVFRAYEGNMSKASTWLFDTFNKTLRKDFIKADETVRNVAKTLRDHREEIFTEARK